MTMGQGDRARLDMGAVTDRLTSAVLSGRAPKGWWLIFAVSVCLAAAFLIAIGLIVSIGVGLMGMNIPVAWAFPIVNTIWWIGIAHAGTLISAVLFLTRQSWRAPVVRFAEAMSMFAIMLAGIFPLLHLGRPWLFYYLFPHPNSTDLWPQWKSPLVWDFFAIATYLIFTTLFLYLSLIPDIAVLRDRAKHRVAQVFYGLLALGWRNSIRHWQRYQQAYFVFAVLAAPIVVSVTGVISLDLAVSIVPGYHFTIFPPYFVAGALFSGFATVILIAITVRWMFGMQDLITPAHIDRLAKLMLTFGLVVDYAYMNEMFIAWYSGTDAYHYVYIDRWTGPYAPFWWDMILCNVVLLQFVWFRRVRRSLPAMFALAFVVDLGMWLERYQIVLTSTHADFMPANWDVVWPTTADWAIQFGSIGLFVTLLLVFARLMPVLSIKEMRESQHEEGR